MDRSFIFSNVANEAVGDAGNIDITTSSLSLTNLAFLSSSNLGKGNAGTVKVKADTISLNESFMASLVTSTEEVSAGGIDITTGSLSIVNNSRLSTDTYGKGNAGTIKVEADTVSLDRSFIFSNVANEAVGDAGNIDITTSSLSLTNLAFLSSSNLGKGNAGTVKVKADTIFLK
ncbi:hypothetical protein IQ238_11620 [Pleurocapsales cyanobacterium LEGE 06147]|nr:hypothetical protein [Pleurocapsales cyanobacterium LEGE 06147]